MFLTAPDISSGLQPWHAGWLCQGKCHEGCATLATLGCLGRRCQLHAGGQAGLPQALRARPSLFWRHGGAGLAKRTFKRAALARIGCSHVWLLGLRAGMQAGLPLPYRSQAQAVLPSAEELEAVPEGPCRSVLLRSRMLRSLCATQEAQPHCGLGLPGYVQVTSPIRRYTDLLAHWQLKVSAASWTSLLTSSSCLAGCQSFSGSLPIRDRQRPQGLRMLLDAYCKTLPCHQGEAFYGTYLLSWQPVLGQERCCPCLLVSAWWANCRPT